jgi:hypothetical protein
MKRLVVNLAVLAGALTAVVPAASAQAPAPKPATAAPMPAVPRKIETALPPNGQIPTFNPLPPRPGVHDEAEQSSIQARVLHFLQHLFGGPMPHEFRSPFSTECGQRPCPYDYRN